MRRRNITIIIYTVDMGTIMYIHHLPPSSVKSRSSRLGSAARIDYSSRVAC